MSTNDKTHPTQLQRTSITLPADLRAAMEARAKEADRSLSREMTRAVRHYLKETEEAAA